MASVRSNAYRRSVTAREDVFRAARQLAAVSVDGSFTVDEVVELARRRGSTAKESTIRTHVTSRMCVDAPDTTHLPTRTHPCRPWPLPPRVANAGSFPQRCRGRFRGVEFDPQLSTPGARLHQSSRRARRLFSNRTGEASHEERGKPPATGLGRERGGLEPVSGC